MCDLTHESSRMALRRRYGHFVLLTLPFDEEKGMGFDAVLTAPELARAEMPGTPVSVHLLHILHFVEEQRFRQSLRRRCCVNGSTRVQIVTTKQWRALSRTRVLPDDVINATTDQPHLQCLRHVVQSARESSDMVIFPVFDDACRHFSCAVWLPALDTVVHYDSEFQWGHVTLVRRLLTPLLGACLATRPQHSTGRVRPERAVNVVRKDVGSGIAAQSATSKVCAFTAASFVRHALTALAKIHLAEMYPEPAQAGAACTLCFGDTRRQPPPMKATRSVARQARLLPLLVGHTVTADSYASLRAEYIADVHRLAKAYAAHHAHRPPTIERLTARLVHDAFSSTSHDGQCELPCKKFQPAVLPPVVAPSGGGALVPSAFARARATDHADWLRASASPSLKRSAFDYDACVGELGLVLTPSQRVKFDANGGRSDWATDISGSIGTAVAAAARSGTAVAVAAAAAAGAALEHFMSAFALNRSNGIVYDL